MTDKHAAEAREKARQEKNIYKRRALHAEARNAELLAALKAMLTPALVRYDEGEESCFYCGALFWCSETCGPDCPISQAKAIVAVEEKEE